MSDDRLVLHGIDDLQARDDLAGCEHANLELVVGQRGDTLGEELTRAEDRVERLRKARGHTPLHLGHGLGNCWSRKRTRSGYCRTTNAGGAHELATLHLKITP